MDITFKAIGIAIITVVICLFLSKQNKDIAVLVSIAACCLIGFYAMHYMEAILVFIDDLKILGDLDAPLLTILLKAAGICLIGEITNLICVDAGNGALGKTVQITTACGILWMALPLFSSLIDLLNSILGEV